MFPEGNIPAQSMSLTRQGKLEGWSGQIFCHGRHVPDHREERGNPTRYRSHALPDGQSVPPSFTNEHALVDSETGGQFGELTSNDSRSFATTPARGWNPFVTDRRPLCFLSKANC